MLYHKELEITEGDVTSEHDISKLIEWRVKIEMEVFNIKRRIDEMTDAGSIKRAKDAKSYRSQLVVLIQARVKELKRLEGKEILLMRKFMKVAKKELGKNQYREILEKAKEISGYDR